MLLMLNEGATCAITESNLVENSLDVDAYKMLFYILATACERAAFAIVRNVPGGLETTLETMRELTSSEQPVETLGHFVKRKRDIERLSINFKGELGRWSQARCSLGDDASHSQGVRDTAHGGGLHLPVHNKRLPSDMYK